MAITTITLKLVISNSASLPQTYSGLLWTCLVLQVSSVEHIYYGTQTDGYTSNLQPQATNPNFIKTCRNVATARDINRVTCRLWWNVHERIQSLHCYRSAIPCREMYGMAPIITWHREEKKSSTEKAITPKPQMPAVAESCIYTRLPSPAADCVVAECCTCYSTQSCWIISMISKARA